MTSITGSQPMQTARLDRTTGKDGSVDSFSVWTSTVRVTGTVAVCFGGRHYGCTRSAWPSVAILAQQTSHAHWNL